ncbi:MAG TPA: efflux RND transporter periplasmic adaptor subunit [Steroidobacteraceae bacterium]|jgi:RND family efflux transporter MFP subunit|nr:efflux RND transporter periplasmic adaptor subunit [Steroidobacteraceae bacterium]
MKTVKFFVLCTAALLPWLAGCSHDNASAAGTEGDADAATASALVQIVPLRQGTAQRMVNAYGVVQATPAAQNTVPAPLAAQVAQLYVRNGQSVTAGAPLVQLLPTPGAAASYSQAVSALKVAIEATQRTRQLLSQFLATQQQLADAQKAESDARAALTALQAQGAGGPSTLRAPFDAIVTDISATTHALVTEGTPLIELARPGGLVLMVGVPPDAAMSVKAGDRAIVTAVGSSSAFAGNVVVRGALVQSDSGLVSVEITLPAQKFVPGEAAQASISVGNVSGYLVPHDAVLIDDSGDEYVVQAVGGKGKLVDVKVLGTQDANDVISGALDANAPLVTTGNYQVQEGMPLRFATAAQPSGQRATP